MKQPSGPPGKPSSTTLAFDYGRRRIGVAVGDRVHRTASALCTLTTRGAGADWVALDALVAEWQPGCLLVGLPHHADGTESETAVPARAFATELAARYAIAVELVDESLTSRAADAELREQRRSGMLRRRVGRDDSDRIAARLILEAWLARHPDCD